MELVTRFFHEPKHRGYFLFGPRGTGKSIWLKHAHPHAAFIDLLEPEIFRQYRSNPQRLRELVEASTQNTFVIDEVQKAPDLLSLVHALIEEGKQRRFILTGSSARKLRREGVDLLGGRASLTYMYPFMAAELQEKFSLNYALQYGMLPLLYGSPDPDLDLKTYLALYMKEEVQQEGLVRDIDGFSQFLELISFSQGSILNSSNVARECGVSSRTVENYVSLLEDLLLCFRLPVFTKKSKRHLVAKPKFYYFDAGVYRAIRPKGPLDFSEELGGITLETLVAQHLRAYLGYSKQQGDLYFWRTKGGLEVDFVVYGEIGFYVIEVKHASNVYSKDLRGLQAFKTDYPQANCILLYQGKEVLKKGDVLCMPVEQFLLSLKPDQALIHK